MTMNSFTPANSRTTPSSTPTEATEVMLKRSTITEISSHRIPVTRNNHHRPDAARDAIFDELSIHPPCRAVPMQPDLRMLPPGQPRSRERRRE